jgi:hypothetical protein
LAKIDDVMNYKVNINNNAENNKHENSNNNIKNKTDITNQIITQIMKLSTVLIDEKHPSVVLKTLKSLHKLFEYIRMHGIKLNIDLNITDSVCSKIKKTEELLKINIDILKMIVEGSNNEAKPSNAKRKETILNIDINIVFKYKKNLFIIKEIF